MGDLVNMSGFDYDFYEDEFDEEPEYGGNTEEEEEDDVIIIDEEKDDVEVVDDVNMERDNLSQRNFAEDHIQQENNGYFHDDDFGYTPRRPRTPQNVPRISREETEFDEIHEFINEAGMNASISRIVDTSAIAWKMTIHFPRGTITEMSNVIIKFPVDYPHAPPVLYCTDNIDHPFLGLRNFIPFKRLRNEYWAEWIPISVVIVGVYELFKDHLCRRRKQVDENINPHLIKIPENAIDTYLRITKAKISRETPFQQLPVGLHIRTYFKLYEEQEELAQVERKLSILNERKRKLTKNIGEHLKKFKQI